MPLLCREKEYDLLRKLLGGECIDLKDPKPPSLIFVQGGPQTGKKCLVSSVFKSFHALNGARSKTQKQLKVRSALLSCHLGSFGSSAIFEELWRQINSQNEEQAGIHEIQEQSKDMDIAGSANNLSEFVFGLKKMFQHDADLNVSSLTIIGFAHAEMLRNVESNVLPGLIRLASVVQSRLNSTVSNSLCVILMSRLPWNKWELDSTLNSSPIIVKLEPYSKSKLSILLNQYLITTYGTKRKNVDKNAPEVSEDLPEDFYRIFSDVILGTFSAVAKSFPQFVSAARMVLPVYMKPIEEEKIESDNSRALYRNIEPFLKKSLTTANLKEAYGQNFEEQMKLQKRCYEQVLSSDGTMSSEEPKTYSRLDVELPFISKFLLISAYIASYNPVKSDKRFFMKYHGKFRKRVQKSASLAAHKRSSQLLGPKMFCLDRMLAIFYVIVDIEQDGLKCVGGASANILSQISSLVTLNLMTSQLDAGLDAPKYKCNIGLDFIRLVAKNVRFEIHKYLYDIDNQ